MEGKLPCPEPLSVSRSLGMGVLSPQPGWQSGLAKPDNPDGQSGARSGQQSPGRARRVPGEQSSALQTKSLLMQLQPRVDTAQMSCSGFDYFFFFSNKIPFVFYQ